MDSAEATAGREAETILVVDDDEGIRAVLRAYLEPHYLVLEAEDGQSALDTLPSYPVDLVLLDVKMPGRSGFDICRTIKDRPVPGFLPVLLLTALDQQASRNEGLASGADDFLTKPVDRQELLLRVAAFLRVRSQERLIRKQLADLQRMQSLKDFLFKLIVHDLRNPLASVEGYLKMIREEVAGDEEPVRDYAIHALRSAGELTEILDGVAEVYVLEEGKRTIAREPVAMRLVVNEALETVLPAESRGQPKVEVVVEENTVVPIDRRLVRRCVENLVNNALTYSSEGDAVIVTIKAEDGGAIVEVADRGPGIPDDMKPVLFEKFGSVEGWRSASRRGLGLSLHLVKLVVSAHGGAVSVRDREGGGSIFQVYFPGEKARRD